MKRRPRIMFKLLLFLLAGAIINVAVAWGCALWVPSPTHGELLTEEQAIAIVQLALPGIQLGSASGVTYEALGNRVVSISGMGEKTFAKWESVNLWKWHHGWPCYSMNGFMTADRVGVVQLPVRLRSWLRPKNDLFGSPMLSMNPLWPGFAINTILYAAALWVLFAAPFKIRCWRRIKRGQCASCGYSLRGTPNNEKCPECGATA